MSDPLWKKVEDAAKEGVDKVDAFVDNAKDNIVQGVTKVEQGADSFLDKVKKSNWTWAILLGVIVLQLVLLFN